jgi:DNA polymerase III epsilon subunit-like protein
LEGRVVEIGVVEPLDHAPTGCTFHRYVCPECSMPADAVAVHGLTTEFLADKPLFGDVADELWGATSLKFVRRFTANESADSVRIR